MKVINRKLKETQESDSLDELTKAMHFDFIVENIRIIRSLTNLELSDLHSIKIYNLTSRFLVANDTIIISCNPEIEKVIVNQVSFSCSEPLNQDEIKKLEIIKHYYCIANEQSLGSITNEYFNRKYFKYGHDFITPDEEILELTNILTKIIPDIELIIKDGEIKEMIFLIL